jgi:PAS domain S-box-containing protein
VRKAERRAEHLEQRLAAIEEERSGLLEREARFRILSELTSDSCWARWGTKEGATQRLWVNDAFQNLTGYSPEEFEAIGREGLVHPEDLAAALEFVDPVPGVTEHEFRILRKDGEIRWLREKMLVEHDGDSVLVLGATQDVTPQKEAERVLREGNRLLEERVRHRTRQLEEEIQVRRHTEEALRQARDQAQAASQAKSRFLANMSHEMRTPLNGVLGIAGMLLRGDIPGETRSRLELLRSSAESLLELIESILDFSRIEADRLTLECRDFSLSRVEGLALGVLRQKAEDKGLALEVHRGGDVPDRLRGDGARVRQILLNLMDNAIKFTDSGGVTLTASREVHEGERIWLRFEVQDTGIGIAPEVQRHLFEPFSQGDDSTARRYGGTGLGLAICQRLTALMGGEIQVRSVPGEGATFLVRLPFDPPSPTPEDEVPAPAALPLESTRQRILIAEDSPINQIVLTLQLEALGLHSHVVASGEEVLQAVESESYALILMDCQMPGMDGYEAAREIRRQEVEGQHLPIIAVTASAIQEDLDRCYEVGMDAVLSKPYREEELRSVLARWLVKVE